MSLELQGTESNRDAVGARVEVTTKNKKYIDEVRSGRGYQGHFGSRLHFGLGNSATVKLRVRWPSGKIDKFDHVKINHHLSASRTRLNPGTGIVAIVFVLLFLQLLLQLI